MKILEIISGINCILNEATIKHFAHLGLDPNNSYHAELVDAYNMGVSSRDPDVPKNANQIKSIEQLEKVVGKHLEKIHDKQLEKLIVYDNPKTGIKVFKVRSARQCRTVASDTHWCVVSKEKGDYHFKDYDPSVNYSYVIWTPEPNLEKIGIIGITPFTESKYYAQQFVNQNNTAITDDQWSMLRKKYNLDEVEILSGIRGIPLSEKRKEELLKEVTQYPQLAIEYARKLSGRFPEGEPAIAKSGKYSVEYAQLTREKFPQGEPEIAKSGEYSANYAYIFRDKFPAGEPEIAKSGEYSALYARAIKGKFPAGEPEIAKNAKDSFEYAKIIGRFPQGEPAIARDATYAFEYAILIGDPDPLSWHENYIRKNPSESAKDPRSAVKYAKMIGKKFPEGEPAIAKNLHYSLEYAKLFGRFPAGEPEIAKDPDYSLRYAKTIDDKFPAGEPAISKSAMYSVEYAKIIGRFPAGEPAISKSAEYSFKYAKIFGRFPAGEPEIAKDVNYSLLYAKIIGRFPAGETEIAKSASLSLEYAKIIGDPDPDTWRERYLKGEIK